jgi:hypothetical protein
MRGGKKPDESEGQLEQRQRSDDSAATYLLPSEGRGGQYEGEGLE